MANRLICAVQTLRVAGFSEEEISKITNRPAITRDVEIAQRALDGEHIESIATEYGLTHQRVSQILDRTCDGKLRGVRVRYMRREVLRTKEKFERFLVKYGLTPAQYEEVRAAGDLDLTDDSRPFAAFNTQYKNSQKRRIVWELSFWQWWCIWKASGKWSERGRNKKQRYVLGRIDSSGPYSVSNAKVMTLKEAVAAGFAYSSAAHRKELAAQRRERETLSSMENIVLRLTKEGMTPNEIAEHLGKNKKVISRQVTALSRRYLS